MDLRDSRENAISKRSFEIIDATTGRLTCLLRNFIAILFAHLKTALKFRPGARILSL